jgi:acetyl-CoA carboxylase biotin carboxyl carrier protein
MNPSEIKALIDAMAASDLAEMEWSRDGWTLRLLRHPNGRTPQPAGPSFPLSVPSGTPVPRATAATAVKPDHHLVCAPVAGIVYLSPTPGAAAFAPVGTRVEAGTTLCVVEAMKIFIEVRTEHAGVVEAVLVRSDQDVAFDQPLFRIA